MFALMVAAALPTAAHADAVSDLAAQLTNSDYKIRLTAVLSLSKLNDPRAAPPLVRALKDVDKSVRGAAATGLGKLLRLGLPAGAKAEAIAGLTEAKSDKDAGVRKQVERALAAVPADPGPSTGDKSIYIDLGDMVTKPDQAALKPAMERAVRGVFAKNADGWQLAAPGGKAIKLTKSQQGFHVGGTVTELTTKQSGKNTLVTCKVSMFIATYPEKSMFGFLSGGASVETPGSNATAASADCVVAVMEDLVARKVIPTIKTRSGR